MPAAVAHSGRRPRPVRCRVWELGAAASAMAVPLQVPAASAYSSCLTRDRQAHVRTEVDPGCRHVSVDTLKRIKIKTKNLQFFL